MVKNDYLHIGLQGVCQFAFGRVFADALGGYYLTVPPMTAFWGHDKLELVTKLRGDFVGSQTFETTIRWSNMWLAGIMSLISAGSLIGCCIPRSALWWYPPFDTWWFGKFGRHHHWLDRQINKSRFCCDMNAYPRVMELYQTVGALCILGAAGLIPKNGSTIKEAVAFAKQNDEVGGPWTSNEVLVRMMYYVLLPFTVLLAIVVTTRIALSNDLVEEKLEEARWWHLTVLPYRFADQFPGIIRLSTLVAMPFILILVGVAYIVWTCRGLRKPAFRRWLRLILFAMRDLPDAGE